MMAMPRIRPSIRRCYQRSPNLARYGVLPGAYIYIADSALVTEDDLVALGDTLFLLLRYLTAAVSRGNRMTNGIRAIAIRLVPCANPLREPPCTRWRLPDAPSGR